MSTLFQIISSMNLKEANLQVNLIEQLSTLEPIIICEWVITTTAITVNYCVLRIP